MNRVPLDERRRLFVAQQRARDALREQLLRPAPADPFSPPAPPHSRVRLIVKAVTIAMLLGVGLVAFQAVTFHLPTSVVEALLPRF